MRTRSLILLAVASLTVTGCSDSGSTTSKKVASPESTDALSSGGTDNSDPTMATYPLDELGNPNVPKSVVEAWPAKFCSLTVGMTRYQVWDVMGRPTQSFSGSSANQDEWDGYNVSVTAFYDMNEKVIQLDDSTGTSDLPCESSRK